MTGCGFQTGLSILLDPLEKDYFGSFFDSIGFEFLIHDAYDYPDDNSGFKMLSYGRETFIRVFPEKTYASQDIQNLDASQRSCRFSREIKLKGMKRYSYINCMAECRSRLVFQRCGCIPLTTPNSDNYPFCNHFDQILCVNESRGELFSSKKMISIRTRHISDVFMGTLPGFNESIFSAYRIREVKEDLCGCFEDCDFNRYESEITMGTINPEYVLNNKLT